jgi:26S proteasome regulatory subunit N2
MLNDAVNYVRQGVLIASALICIQHTEATCPKVCYYSIKRLFLLILFELCR